jgi:hypothetical protein
MRRDEVLRRALENRCNIDRAVGDRNDAVTME